MVLSTFFVLLLFLFRNYRSNRRHNEESDQLANINYNRCIDERSQRCAMINDNFEIESYRDKEIEKLKEETELLKQEIIRMKREFEEKGCPKCDTNKSEKTITDSSPSLFNEPQLPTPSFDADNPFFDVCGIRISLRGHDQPDTVTIQHSMPNDLEHFENLRQEGLDFDKTIKIGDETINIHKTLLGARIPFFMNLLSANWIEGSSEIISLPYEYDSAIIERIIDFAYTGRLTITQDSVQSLMKTASFLCMEEIVDECYQFMRKRIEFDDALPFLFFCRAIGYNEEDEYLMKFIAVFDAVDKWIGNYDNRKIFGPRLLKLIRCPCLSPSFLTQIALKRNWILDNPECIDIINETLGIGKNTNVSLNNTRRKSNVHNLIIITTSNEEYDNHCEDWSRISIFDPLKNEWHHGFIECHKLNKDVAVVGDQTFFMGHKREGKLRKGTMIVLNTRRNQFHKLSMPSLVDRFQGVYGVADSKIFSTGNDWDPPTIFDPTNASAGWTKLPSMLVSRHLATSCELDGKLYVMGGLINEGLDTRDDGECYDPATNEWTGIGFLKVSITEGGAAALNGEIYLVGGCGRVGGPLRYLQRYSPKSDSWEQLLSMRHARSSPLVNASGGMLYVSGGFDIYEEPVRFMEKYDPSTNTWEELDNIPEFPKKPIMWSHPIPASFPTPNEMP